MFRTPVVATIACVSLVAITYVYALNDAPNGFNWPTFHFQSDPNDHSSPAWAASIALVVTMLVGLVFGAIYEILQRAPGDEVKIPDLFVTMVRSRQFWLAVLAAPFALFVILSFKSGPTGSVEHFAFAFQNGFFVKALIPTPSRNP